MSNLAAIRTNLLSPKLTEAQQQNNAGIIAAHFRAQGWTDNAIAAMLGNMDIESNGLNPAQFQAGYPIGTATGGYGLVQWTPRTKYSDWAGPLWEQDHDLQLSRIDWELANGQQWMPRASYGYMTFQQFSRSTDTVDYLTGAFLYCYENPADPEASIAIRRSRAAYWYQYITGIAPHVPVWLLFKIRWRR